MTHLVEVFVTYNYSLYSIMFSKVIEMPCAPFFGMWIIEEDDGEDAQYELVNNESTQTIIGYHLKSNSFEVNVRNFIQGLEVAKLDDIMKSHKHFKWKREDRTDIEALKRLITYMK